MSHARRNMLLLSVLFVVLMSIPWLVPHCGALSLLGLVPLLMMENIALEGGVRHFFRWHYASFLAWNAVTTFWVCNATVGGGIFASAANALQMSVIFAVFHQARKRLGSGALPYILLSLMWIAWERFYYSAQISWPWLVLGNAFARSLTLIQWYEFTGVLGGSLWIWMVNLMAYDFIVNRSWRTCSTGLASARLAGLLVVAIAPMCLSRTIYDRLSRETEAPGGTLQAVIGQPDFDPYEKFESLKQREQTAILLDLYEAALDTLERTPGQPLLLLAPETFTSDITVGQYESSPTWQSFRSFLQDRPGVSLVFGASTYDYINRHARPNLLARRIRDGLWYNSHNSAISLDGSGRTEIFHKSKLVVGTELTPFPRIFVPLDDMLGGVMGRCVGQDEVSLLHVGDIPLGCAVCYESVYGEYCTGYVRKGARALAVITNDAWWGDTPGYRQHLSYSSLRAIELRRDIVRCANTGISAFIDCRGEIVSRSSWWHREVLSGTVTLRDGLTFFARHGDLVGRACTWGFLALLLMSIVLMIIPKQRYNES